MLKINNIKRGFTLAEILVAMLVFSVIAAMLIPNVSQNAERNLFSTQLQKVQNDVQQAVLMMMAENQGTLKTFCLGDDSGGCFVKQIASRLENKVVFSDDDTSCDEKLSPEKNACTQAGLYADKEPKLLNKATDAIAVPVEAVVNLANGASVNVVFNAACNCVHKVSDSDDKVKINVACNNEQNVLGNDVGFQPKRVGVQYQVCGYMEIDTNAAKAPNIVGKDIHYFWIIDKDGLIPFGEIENFTCVPASGAAATAQLGCTYRLMQEGRITYY